MPVLERILGVIVISGVFFAGVKYLLEKATTPIDKKDETSEKKDVK